MMSVLRHAFDWGYGYVLLALIGGMILKPLVPEVSAGEYMSTSLLVDLGTSENESKRAMAHGYIAAVYDDLEGRFDSDDPRCFLVPKSVDMYDMASRALHFVNWFVYENQGYPRETKFPAKDFIHLGLVKHFPCEQI